MRSIKTLFRDSEKALILITGLVAVALFIHFARIGWNHTIQEHHGFRQTQTALSAYFMKDGAPFFLYETPVLGPPWSIPMEFPLFQGMVALFSKITHYPIEQSARLLNLTLILTLIWPISILLKVLNIPRKWALLFFSLLILSPNYQYWTRTFMIEPLALCLSFYYLAAFASNVNSTKVVRGYWILSLGALASMVKITTFFSFAICGSLWLCWDLFRIVRNKDWQTLKSKFLINGLLGIAGPLAIGYSLSKYYDIVREQNPLARNFLTIEALHDWNFGTWQQKIDPNVWINFYNMHVKNSLGLPYLAIVILGVSVFLGKYGALAWLCTGLFVVNLAVFTNLYIVHDYYAYANSIYLVFALGFCLYGIRQRLSWILALPAAIVCLFILNVTYQRDYLPYQLTDGHRYATIGHLIQEKTDKEDVLIIWGHDWSPEVPYVSKRRAIMDRQNRDLEDPSLTEALNNLGQRKIGALVFCDGSAASDFIAQKPSRFGISDVFSEVDGCKVYFGKSPGLAKPTIF
jgi:hypothetical protein